MRRLTAEDIFGEFSLRSALWNLHSFLAKTPDPGSFGGSNRTAERRVLVNRVSLRQRLVKGPGSFVKVLFSKAFQ